MTCLTDETQNNFEDAMLLILSIGFIILTLGGTLACYNRRDTFPFKGRFMPMLIGTNLFMFLLVIDILLVARPFGLIFPFPCGLHAIFVCTALVFIQIFYVMRAWILLFRCKVHGAYVQMRKQKKSDEEQKQVKDDTNWWTSNIARKRPKFLVQLAAVDYAVSVILVMITFFIADKDKHGKMLEGDWGDDTQKYGTCAGCQPGAMVWVMVGFIGCVHAIVLIILAFKLRSVFADAFFIRKELTVTGIGILILLTIYIVGQVILNSVRSSDSQLGMFVGTACCLLLLGSSTFMPLVYSVIEVKKRQAEDKIIEGLREVIQKTQQRDALLEFLKSEFSTENLFFYEDTDKLMNEIDDMTMQDLINKTSDIFYNFVEDDADQQINIPSGIRAAMKLKCISANNWTEEDRAEVKELLMEAQKEVFKLMEKDSFVRWQRSKFAEPFTTRSPTAVSKGKRKKSHKLISEVSLDQPIDLSSMK